MSDINGLAQILGNVGLDAALDPVLFGASYRMADGTRVDPRDVSSYWGNETVRPFLA